MLADQDPGDQRDAVALLFEAGCHVAGDVDVGEESHAADDSSMLRPEASQAAYCRLSATSAGSSSGNSSTI
jgi:hypothetical protein